MTRWGLRNVQPLNRPLLHQLLFGGNKINFGAAPVGQSPLCGRRNGNVGHVTRRLALRSATGRKEPTLRDPSSSLPLLLFFFSLRPRLPFCHACGGSRRNICVLLEEKNSWGQFVVPPAEVEKLFNVTIDLSLHLHKGELLDIDQCDMFRKV